MGSSWSDAPIKSRGQDEFDRADYAAHAARLITSTHTWEDSIVFGLTGPWGSGKSSMLEMIAEFVAENHADWRVARFTPWASGDVGSLLGDFYASLSSALPRRQAKRLRRAFGTLVVVSSPAANTLPWGHAIAAITRAAGERLRTPTPWDKAFGKASRQLKATGTPVLMIADDIDRLQREELLALLKVVRLLGRFPGVHYLLAYDETTLFRTLSEGPTSAENDGTASRFMEKIVQYPLVVPPLLSTQLLSRLDAGMTSALVDSGRTTAIDENFGRLKNVLLNQLPTPRAIDRFVAQLRHHLPLVDLGEVDDYDVIILTLVRLAFPEVYLLLPHRRDELVSGKTGDPRPGKSGAIERAQFDVESLLYSVPVRDRADAITLLRELFPMLRSHATGPIGQQGCRISDSRYFDRYFTMNIPAHDISDSAVGDAVARAQAGQPQELRALLADTDTGRAQLVISKAIASTDAIGRSADDDARRLAMLRAIVPAVEEVVDNDAMFFSPQAQVMAWASELVGKLSDAILPEAVIEVLDLASTLGRQIELVGYDDAQSATPAWFSAVADYLTERATAALVEHLRARDSAPLDGGHGTMLHFLRVHDHLGPIVKAVKDGIEAGEFGYDDVAARCVKISRLLGVRNAEWKLGELDEYLFSVLVREAPGTWKKPEPEHVDTTDTSWPSRRKFAASRAFE